LKNYRRLAITTVLLLFSTNVTALELGKISSVSHLGESFYAEVPLALDQDEEISNLFVELATPAEYRAHNVHRDQALKTIRADVKSDMQGNRIELSSEASINAPFITLILKVRYNRATHFKQYPVFMNLSRAARPVQAIEKNSIPPVKEKPLTTTDAPATSRVDKESDTGASVTDRASPPFTPFDGWARTSHYGPVIFGDAIYTIANRLRIDKRYTIRQVMVALFEKNRTKFADANLNLPLHGSYLDVPMAEEVEQSSHNQALAIIEEHAGRWRAIMKQPQYAVVAEAQKSRYSKRERVAKAVKAARAASGMDAPVSGD